MKAAIGITSHKETESGKKIVQMTGKKRSAHGFQNISGSL
jgi:hypothetical protein